MAKQSKEVKKFEFSKVGSILDNIAKSVPIQIEKEIKEKTFITTEVGRFFLRLNHANQLSSRHPSTQICNCIINFR